VRFLCGCCGLPFQFQSRSSLTSLGLKDQSFPFQIVKPSCQA
jgi:hypothetical protein